MVVISAKPPVFKCRDEIEVREHAQTDYLDDDNVVIGPAEWFQSFLLGSGLGIGWRSLQATA